MELLEGQEPIDQQNTPEQEYVPTKDEKDWSLGVHLSSFAGYFIPFGNIIGPLVIWLVKKEGYPFLDYHGKEALNFQISITIYVVALLIIGLLTMIILVGFMFLALIGLLAIFDLVVTIIAAIKASEGKPYEYPMSIRFIK